MERLVEQDAPSHTAKESVCPAGIGGLAVALAWLLAGCDRGVAPADFADAHPVIAATVDVLAFYVVWVPAGFVLLLVINEPYETLRRARDWYRGLRPVPRALLRRLVVLFVVGGGTELLLDALGAAGVDPLAIGLAGAAFYILLLRGLVLLARDAQVAIEAWCEREAQRLVAGFVRAIEARASDASRARGAAVPPPHAARPAGPRERRIEAGPTCWICGGVNDGHRH